MSKMSLKDRLAAKKEESVIMAEIIRQDTKQHQELGILDNIDFKSKELEPLVKIEVKEETPSIGSDPAVLIKYKIKELQTLSGVDLEQAMKNLKQALIQNPAACSLLLPEEVGAMVDKLRQITGQSITAAKTSKEKKDNKKALSAEEMQSAFDEL
jgi:hypothetical protein